MARNKTAAVLGMFLAVPLAALSVLPVSSSAAEQKTFVVAQNKVGGLSEKEIMKMVSSNNTTPVTSKFSVGEVVTINAQEVKCFKKKAGGMVQVRCPDKIVVTTK